MYLYRDRDVVVFNKKRSQSANGAKGTNITYVSPSEKSVVVVDKVL